MPLLIQFRNLPVLTGSFIVHNNQLTVRANPNIIHRAAHTESRFGVCIFNSSFQSVAPSVHTVISKWDGINAVLLHERVRRCVRAVNVKFFLQKSVNSAIEIKRKSGRTFAAKLIIYVKASRALQKQAYLRA